MAIGIVGIIFLSRLHEAALGKPAAGWSPLRWRIQVAARKVARAQDQRDPETARSGVEPAPDRAELFRRPGDGFRVFESRRVGWPEVVRCRRLGRRPFVPSDHPIPENAAAPETLAGAGLRGPPPRTANQ